MDALTRPGDSVGTLMLRDVDGEPVALDDPLERPLAVPLVRYYGCMPCRGLPEPVRRRPPGLEAAGVGVVGVAARPTIRPATSWTTASASRCTRPRPRLYEALDVRRIHWWMLLWLRTWWNYLRAARRARQGRITAHPLQAPGFVILDTDRTVRFLYRGRTLGDYPPITTIVAAASGLGRTTE